MRSTRSVQIDFPLGRGCNYARQGPFRSTFRSAGAPNALDRGRSDRLSARQGLHLRSTGAVQIDFPLGKGCKCARQGPFRSTFRSVGAANALDKGRSDCPSARQGSARQASITSKFAVMFRSTNLLLQFDMTSLLDRGRIDC